MKHIVLTVALTVLACMAFDRYSSEPDLTVAAEPVEMLDLLVHVNDRDALSSDIVLTVENPTPRAARQASVRCSVKALWMEKTLFEKELPMVRGRSKVRIKMPAYNASSSMTCHTTGKMT